jgi:hypothetical protein
MILDVRKPTMKTFLRCVVALVLGPVVGGSVNMGIIVASPHVIPPPAGVDVNDAKSIGASIHLFEPKHFLFPFLAHALGTLCGAVVGFLVAARFQSTIAYLIGALFLAGGIAAASMIPAPTWFIALDLLVAYLPMAWLGAVIGRKVRPRTHHAQ